MTVGRWYPTATVLGDGRVLVFSGDNIVRTAPGVPPPFIGRVGNSLPEIYDPATEHVDRPDDRPALTSPLYPFMFVLSDGRILDAGPDMTTRVLDAGHGTWTTIGDEPVRRR